MFKNNQLIEMIAPKPGSTLKREIKVEGKLLNNRDIEYVWCLVKIKNKYCPKPEVKLISNKLEGEFREDGSYTDNFSIVFINASYEMHCFLQNWCRYTAVSQKFPGIKEDDFQNSITFKKSIIYRVKGLKLV